MFHIYHFLMIYYFTKINSGITVRINNNTSSHIISTTRTMSHHIFTSKIVMTYMINPLKIIVRVISLGVVVIVP